MLSVFPVLLASTMFHVVIRLIGLQESHPLLYEALHNYIVLALAEELVKYLTFRRVLRKTDYPYSWMDTAVLMTIVGIGFAFIESIVYAFGASIPVVLVRGLCLPHAGYGFLTGYFYGKGEKNGKTGTKWIGFLLAWFIHGLYDFSLKDQFLALNDNLVFLPLSLALLDIVFVIQLIVFVRKAMKREECLEPLAKQ